MGWLGWPECTGCSFVRVIVRTIIRAVFQFSFGAERRTKRCGWIVGGGFVAVYLQAVRFNNATALLYIHNTHYNVSQSFRVDVAVVIITVIVHVLLLLSSSSSRCVAVNRRIEYNNSSVRCSRQRQCAERECCVLCVRV